MTKTKELRYELLTNLPDANEDEIDAHGQQAGRYVRSLAGVRPQRNLGVAGNVFLFLVAGYEVHMFLRTITLLLLT